MKNNVLSRLGSLESLKEIPRFELTWLVEHGNLENYQPGLIASKGSKIAYLWIILSGRISLHSDSGAGLKVANTELSTGAVTGMLPYSRLKEIPGDLYADEKTEVLSVSTKHFPEMINKCPKFTAHTVHMMIDRTRIYNTSAMQDEKMISLGKMAAGLAHELNNPASVLLRDIKILRRSQTEVDNATDKFIEAGINKEQFKMIRDFLSIHIENSVNVLLTPLEKSDIEYKISNWLDQKKIDTIDSAELSDLFANPDDLEELLSKLPENITQSVLEWIVVNYRINKLTIEIEQSTSQVYQLVEAVKKFTSMDNLAERELVDIESGIKNTLKMLDSKTKSKYAGIILEIEKNIPKIYANGAALNQVWFSLLDNALDAIPLSGNIRIRIGLKTDQIEIRFIDNGPGISPEKINRIFDPFYTTKPPGQGTGLGLDLSRRIIRSHRGDIQVRSNEGKTEFWVNLNINKT